MPHNGCFTHVNEFNSPRQTKQERQSTTGGSAVAAGLAACDVTEAVDLNAEHTEAPLNAKAKCSERTVFLITPPATALQSQCSSTTGMCQSAGTPGLSFSEINLTDPPRQH